MSFFFNTEDNSEDVEDKAYQAFESASHPAIFLTAMVSETMKQVCLKQMKVIHTLKPELSPEEAVKLTDMDILAETVKLILMMASAVDYKTELNVSDTAALSEEAINQMDTYVDELRTILTNEKKESSDDYNIKR
jgi:hypothetical protein